MILEHLAVEDCGGLAGHIELDRPAAGLNILSAPNEAGKSTLVRALTRALFDKHSTRGEEMQSLQPVGTRLGPAVDLEFSTNGQRWRLEKRFLEKPAARLYALEPAGPRLIAEADAADEHVRELVRSTLPGRGATRPEHWGLFEHLWALQGQPLEWPRMDGELGEKLRQHASGVVLDPLAGRLLEAWQAVAERSLTPTGQVRKGGALDLAEQELERVRAALGEVRLRRESAEAALRELALLREQLDACERECTEREREQKEASALKGDAERIAAAIREEEARLAHAREAFARVRRDREHLDALRQRLAQAEGSLRVLAEKAAEAREARERAESERAQAEETAARAAQTLQTARQHLEKARQAAARQRLALELDQLRKQTARIEGDACAVSEVERRLAALPEITEADCSKLERLSSEIERTEAQLAMVGLQIEFTAGHAGKVRIEERGAGREIELAPGKIQRERAGEEAAIEIPGWGRILVRCGAQDLRELAEGARKARSELAAKLAELRVDSRVRAQAIAAERKELARDLAAKKQAFATALGGHESADALRRTAEGIEARLAAMECALPETTLAEVEAQEALARADAEQGEAHARDAEKLAAAARKALEAAIGNLHTAEKAHGEAAVEIAQTREQIERAASQLGAEPERHEREAADAVVLAEARVARHKAGLPPDFEKLPERAERAVRALAEARATAAQLRTSRDRIEGHLAAIGGEGLYARETAWIDRDAALVLVRDAARREAWSARVLCELLGRRQRAQAQRLVGPLEDELGAAFAQLTGDESRRVFLGQDLAIEGAGRRREEAVAFSSLSQGTREQLLLCLRLAVARRLAVDEPQVLILDDVLVNTDAVRQQRVLDLLERESGALQIIVLTCHAERYRGVGRRLEMRRSD